MSIVLEDELSGRLRAPFQWFGGKGNMIAKLLPLVPCGGRPYCEPYAGAANLLFARDPAPVEAINDLDGDIVNLFRCLQNRDTFEELRHRLMWTPYAKAEFARAIDVLSSSDSSPVDRAWAFFVAKNQGLSGKSESVGDWSRGFNTSTGMSEKTSKWLMRLSMLDAWRWRLMRVQIDNRDALEFIEYWDNEDAVFYVDPPYHPTTRKTKSVYAVEPDDAHHRDLVSLLLKCKGAVALSGYACDVYTPLEDAGWKRVDFETACHAAGRVRGSKLLGAGAARENAPRVESVWINPKAQKMTEQCVSTE